MSWVAAVTGWRTGIDALPPGDLRRRGDNLLALGAGSVLAAMLLTPPWASIGLAVAGLGIILARAPIHRLPWLWFGCAYAGWIALSGVVAAAAGIEGAQARPGGPAWTWLATPVVALGMSGLVARRRALLVLTVLTLLAAVLALCQFAIGLGVDGQLLKIDPHGQRFVVSRGFSEHHLTFGLACALLTAGAAQERSAFAASAAAAWLMRAAAALGLAVSGSRAAMLSAGAGVFATFSARGRRWAVIGLAIVLVAGAALVARFAITAPSRLQQMAKLEDGRWPIWRTSLHLIAERPVFGWGGKDGFKAAARDAFPLVNPGAKPEFPEGSPHAHNAALALASEYGLPALALHLAFWISALVWLWRRRLTHPHAWRLGVGVAVVSVVGGMFEPYPTRVVQGAAIHAALGLALALALAPAPGPDQGTGKA